MPKKDKYACFQWIRDVREQMTRDMEGMTPEERSDYIHRKYEEGRKGRPQYTREESRVLLAKYLAEPIPDRKTKIIPARQSTPIRKASGRRKTIKQLVHA